MPLLELADDVLRPRCLAKASYICWTRACARALFADLIFPVLARPSSSDYSTAGCPGAGRPPLGVSSSSCSGEAQSSIFFVCTVFALDDGIAASPLPSPCFF